MKPPTILVVEDNPVSRKMVRVTLESEGYSVIEAPDARTALALFETAVPDLVLQDLLLPDMDGFELVRRLRALPRGAEVPTVALSGFLSRMEEEQVGAMGFSDFLSKPVEPARLVETVRAHFPAELPAPEDGREGPHVLAADDDPIQLKLMRIRLTLAGFRVSCAFDGQEALEMARQEPPAAVLSDVVMPRLDGFHLCLALRSDPRLARVPVVLVSSSSLEEADACLAQDVGANALIPRKADFAEAITALRASLSAEAPRPTESLERLKSGHLDHSIRRLEREAAMSRRLANRCATQAAALSVLSGIAETLARTQDVRAVLGEVLARCVDAGGLSLGVLYLAEPDGGFRLEAHQGYADALTARLQAAFGHADLLREVLSKGVPVVMPSAEMSREVADDFLKEAGAAAAVVVPIVSHEERLGVLVLASGARVLEEGDWIAFARTVAAQVGQAVALTKAVAGIAASEGRYRSLFERNLAGLYRSSPSGRLLECNEAFARVFGYASREEILAVSAADLYPRSEEREAFLRRLGEAGALVSHEWEGQRKDGSPVFAIESAALLREEGAPPVIEGTVVDVTERRRLEEQLRQSQKREALGLLAAGVAHDFNNVLGVITGYSELVWAALPARSPLRPKVKEIAKAGDRAAALVRQLLTFSRKETVDPRLVDLDEIVTDLGGMLRRTIREDIQLVDVLASGTARVKADRGHIEQVILNLVVNARDAMPQGGRLVIETSTSGRGSHAGTATARNVVLSVSDTGIGMDAETRARVFEPFFTTKAAGKGTGLGLATVYGIVTRWGGQIDVASEPGRGTTFTVRFPAAERVARRSREAAAGTGRVPRGSETLLLVEDEATLRELTREVLEGLGYTVLEAAHGEDAIDVSRAHAGPIDLLLSDLVMPRMSGRELAQTLRASRPQVRVLLVSGYAEETVAGDDMPILLKPFDRAVLAQKIRDVLDA